MTWFLLTIAVGYVAVGHVLLLAILFQHSRVSNSGIRM